MKSKRLYPAVISAAFLLLLRIMTTNAARLPGVEKQRGAIQPGMFADVIATRENPLDNIQTLKEVTFVMKDGKVFKRPG